MLNVDLRVEAAAEADRLARARAFAAGAGPFLPDGPLIGIARRNAVRRQLGRRVLVAWRLACEDAAGRVVESTLVAATIASSGGRFDARCADWLNAALPHGVDPRSRQWRDSVERTVQQFTAARVARERAIAEAHIRPTVAFQTGLFDRRADRAHALRGHATAELFDELAARLKGVEAAGTLSFRPPELLLMLIPRDAARV